MFEFVRRPFQHACALALIAAAQSVSAADPAPAASPAAAPAAALPAPDAIVDFTLPAVVEPTIPDHKVSIADHGAVGDGKTMNTEAFAKAIAAAVALGGGHVIIPAGEWLTGPITIQSKIDLHADAGAKVVFSGDIAVIGAVKGLIYGKKLEDVSITGEGKFEGSGETWRPVKQSKQTPEEWKALLAKPGSLTEPKGDIWWPSAAAQKRGGSRPKLVRIEQAERLLIEGATFQNSPNFGLDISEPVNLTIRKALVKNVWFAQNGDGIDIHSGSNIQILDTTVDVGDDGFCMKSNTGKPLTNVLIKGCTARHAHGGFVTGSEELGGMSNIRVENCKFEGTDVGLRLKSGRDRGGVVENFDIHDIQMKDIKTQAILFDMFYQQGLPLDKTTGMLIQPSPAEKVTETTPRYRNIVIRDLTCEGAERAILMTGLPEQDVEGIHIENVKMTAETGVAIMDANHIRLKNVELNIKKGPLLQFFNAKDVVFEKLAHGPAPEGFAVLHGKGNSGIKIGVSDPDAAKAAVKLLDGATADAMVIE